MAAVRKIDNLQILRAIAAFLVVADHSIKVSFGLSHARLMFVAWRAGEIGVAIFFVISGFIMVYTSGKYFGSHTGPLLFMKKRVQRLVPLYWVCVVFALLIFPANTGGTLPYTFERLVKSWFFIPYNDDGVLPIHPVLGVGWTLNYEMAFYLVFAACLVLPRKFAVPACVAALLAVVAAGSVAHGLPHRPSNMFEFWTNPIILLFPAGMLIASIKEREGPVRNSAMLFAPVLVTLIGNDVSSQSDVTTATDLASYYVDRLYGVRRRDGVVGAGCCEGYAHQSLSYYIRGRFVQHVSHSSICPPCDVWIACIRRAGLGGNLRALYASFPCRGMALLPSYRTPADALLQATLAAPTGRSHGRSVSCERGLAARLERDPNPVRRW